MSGSTVHVGKTRSVGGGTAARAEDGTSAGAASMGNIVLAGIVATATMLDALSPDGVNSEAAKLEVIGAVLDRKDKGGEGQ